MTREEAEKVIQELLKNANLQKHLYAVEAILSSLAKNFGEEESLWGFAGLLHDADYELTANNPEEHTLVLEEKLKDYEVPGEVIKAIKAHNRHYSHVEPKSLLDWALICADDLAGLIIATALVMPDKKLSSVRVESVLKKFKDKIFAQGVKRERIKLCEERLGIPLREFIGISLKAMQNISTQLGL